MGQLSAVLPLFVPSLLQAGGPGIHEMKNKFEDMTKVKKLFQPDGAPSLWPAHEPMKEDMVMTMGSYTTCPPWAVEIDSVKYAVSYTESGTSYAGGGTGPVQCRLFTVENLRKNGRGWARDVAQALDQM